MNLDILLEALEDNVMILDGLDDCIIGLADGCAMDTRIVYSEHMIIKKLMDEESLSYEEAYEHFEFNIKGIGGEASPLFMISDFL